VSAAGPRDLLVATTNPGKLREIRGLLRAAPVTLASLADVPPIAEPDETGTTFAANATLKARYYAAATGRRVVAEDSGLVIDAMGGEPGVRSARFVRPDASYPERFAEIWRRLAGVPEAARTARFVCALCVVDGDTIVFEAQGTVEGRIAAVAAGRDGFGYDPIFFYPPLGCTLAQAGARKGEVSHRGAAFRQLATWLTAPSR
jgi:XTP/dITP diphosphohydrolase